MSTLTLLQKKEKKHIIFEGTPTVQQVLENAGISMPHPCGGIGNCGKCAIEILGNVSQPDEAELAAGHRLSCRTRLYGDAVVILKNVTLLMTDSFIAEGFSENIAAACPTESKYKKATINLSESKNHKPDIYLENLKNSTPDIYLSKKIGAAVDIGTTPIALSVYDLSTGKCLAAKTALNPQIAIAADVIGRIDAAINGKLSDLQTMLVSCIQNLAKDTGCFDRIDKWCLTGNTTMLYLLCGRNPQSLAVAPYMADYLFGEEITFLGKPAYLPTCMHAFVGADITCALLASGMCSHMETALLCDIGTNGEIALWKNGTLFVTSTAAGPVFEGAGISCGCQSIAGAIESVSFNISFDASLQESTFLVKTIGNKNPIGICGSGIIDAVACFLENGVLDETGAMEDDSVSLYEGISVTREDIRNIQLAKAAIAAGIRTLLEVTKTTETEVSTFYLAGGFGKHLNLDSAVKIGLFPAELKNKIKVLGNAALQGAAAMLTDETLKEKEASLTKTTKHINLGGDAIFNKFYIDEMFFPE